MQLKPEDDYTKNFPFSYDQLMVSIPYGFLINYMLQTFLKTGLTFKLQSSYSLVSIFLVL